MIRVYNPLLVFRGVAVQVRLCDGSRAGLLRWRGRPMHRVMPIRRYAGTEDAHSRDGVFLVRTKRSQWSKRISRWTPGHRINFLAMRKAMRARHAN